LALIVLDLSGFSFLGVGLRCFPCGAVVSGFSLGYLLSDLVLINRGIWRGIFAALAVVSAGYLNFVCVSSWYLMVSYVGVAYCRAMLFLRTGRNLFGE
jgi:hypothetical protein